eukprot:m51a1_g4446 putative spliceosome rna helicase ddx39b (425) ;mRNA; f:135761-138682
MAAEKKDVDLTQLTEYDSDEEAAQQQTEKKEELKKDTYVAMHSTGFKEFLLKPELLASIQDCGFEHPSEVQHQAIPQAILGSDVLCQAKSGMGKTAVFVLAILQQDIDTKAISTLVICHTRELAFQISKEFQRFSRNLKQVKIAVFIGGYDAKEDRAKVAAEVPNIVVGTPGRIKLLAKDGTFDLQHLKHFVIDECDKVLEQLDMRGDVQDIFKLTPRDKQVMMFTATLTPEMRAICKKFMHNPFEIIVDEGQKLTLHGLQQYYLQLAEAEKTRRLIELLDALEFNQCIIFTRGVQRAEALCKTLCEINFPASCIHSRLAQEERILRYQKFKEFKSRIMVATDLFGRGIDIERVNVVFNYDMPASSDEYLHRVGRAGRFGTKGLAISFVSSKEEGEILNNVQSRFVVNIPELPAEIDPSSYMGS